ncbi:MAG: alpha/beta hydrolase [Jaaginema sp. PMC 1079.18]|nr:alpha/beta hydrolase [Jaaginema sp. PMC 1080.18]MEC4852343.1 alpha/beta hydrolase [Jaaginema sp. PMC 1079.18]MEC4867280.1 alpha/beta hydrolase [Jaaginema sp. PMC 1078.18]
MNLSSSSQDTKFILYAQHGWADTSREIGRLAKTLAGDRALIVTPNLGWWQTWWRIEPLIAKVEAIASTTKREYPDLPWRIIGHSMGGLIWLELLHRHPEWCECVESLVLIASPIGGADLARIIDPGFWGFSIARDLGQNRRILANSIAQKIPTLAIAGDIDNGSDGTIPVSSTEIEQAHWVKLSGLSHPQLKNTPELLPIIQQFWDNPVILPNRDFSPTQKAIRYLQTVPGMTDTHPRHFWRSRIVVTLADGGTIRLWYNPLRVLHVFVSDALENCLYCGFVGWQQTQKLEMAIAQYWNNNYS